MTDTRLNQSLPARLPLPNGWPVGGALDRCLGRVAKEVGGGQGAGRTTRRGGRFPFPLAAGREVGGASGGAEAAAGARPWAPAG